MSVSDYNRWRKQEMNTLRADVASLLDGYAQYKKTYILHIEATKLYVLLVGTLPPVGYETILAEHGYNLFPYTIEQVVATFGEQGYDCIVIHMEKQWGAV